MTASIGDIYIHKDIGDTYLVTDLTSRYGCIGCINLDKGRNCWIYDMNWRVFYRALARTQENT